MSPSQDDSADTRVEYRWGHSEGVTSVQIVKDGSTEYERNFLTCI